MKIYNTDQFEKLKINPIKLDDFDNIKFIEYKYFPTTKKELLEIIIKRIADEGYACDLNDIDTSKITDMSSLFFNMEKFNCDISKWNMLNVETTTGMFYDCKSFNCDISKWNMSNVKFSNSMFNGCYVFNQPIGKWNVSNMIDINYMFFDCRKFDQNLNDWDVSNVVDMNSAFAFCDKLNKPFDKWASKINKVTDFACMFQACRSFNQNLSNWNLTGKPTKGMFISCSITDSNKPKGLQ